MHESALTLPAEGKEAIKREKKFQHTLSWNETKLFELKLKDIVITHLLFEVLDCGVMIFQL